MPAIFEQRSWAAKSASAAAWPGDLTHDPVRFGQDLAAVAPELRRYAMRLARDSDEAADLVQEALARGWRAREFSRQALTWLPGSPASCETTSWPTSAAGDAWFAIRTDRSRRPA